MHVWSCDIGVVMFNKRLYAVVDKILSTRFGSHTDYQGGKIYRCMIERLQIKFCKRNFLLLFIEYRNTQVMSCERHVSSCDVM